ncbi:contractile injection system protein, VgrG/Pvc8 family [Spirulina major CS-329]|uniref:phage late control D family protein n=1 Tax=Spirulina TaxID=1154 RepID=UPI00232E217B|nr:MULTISPECIES: contractile injection system protein, VgrG/Pvc8 family [Spirulina]MDB9496272.1 contractile injection system protein, VgrG/Pvc8 family [Spirulina subsalsa CS-330]MDB9502451.1 contractile injection system protein, VgrG/Pvc8 family [Spirulina major CS-329]
MADYSGVETLTPNIKVSIGGKKLPKGADEDLISVQVFEDIEAPSMFTLEFMTWDLQKGKFTWVDDSSFDVGEEVEIQMGYVNKLKTVIFGEITGLEPEFRQGERPRFIVRGHDLRHRLLRGSNSKSFTKMKDSDIFSKIARARGLTPNTKDSEVKHDYVIQHNQTDWEFLSSRAERMGYEITIEKKNIYFQPPQNDQQKVLTLKFKENLSEFMPRLSSMNQVQKVEVRGWLPDDKKEVLGKAAAGKEGSKMGGKTTGPKAVKTFGDSITTIVTQPVVTKAEADQIALGQFKDMAIAYITAEGTCPGLPTLRVAKVIEVKGVGKRFSGDYYVTATEHHYSQKFGYTTLFTARRTAL